MGLSFTCSANFTKTYLSGAIMNKLLHYVKAPLIIVSIITMAILAGLFIPLILAQEDPLTIGYGSLQKIEILNSSKCEATVRVYSNSIDWEEAVISVPQGQCSKATGDEIAAEATQRLQNSIDNCVNRNTLPSDDPDRDTDPAQGSLFWRDNQICSRPVVVIITWTGVSYTLTWRSSNVG